jgi:hypothetical protein
MPDGPIPIAHGIVGAQGKGGPSMLRSRSWCETGSRPDGTLSGGEYLRQRFLSVERSTSACLGRNGQVVVVVRYEHF